MKASKLGHIPLIALIAIILLSLLLSSCSPPPPAKKNDLEQFSPYISDIETTRDAIPSDQIEKFSYVDGYFYYEDAEFYDEQLEWHWDERLLIYIKYSAADYSSAKRYAMENLDISEDPVERVGDYTFHDNFTNRRDFQFPYNFLRFAYNDSENVLIFMSFYTNSTRELYEANYKWDEFLEAYFGEWYSFDQKGG